MSLSEESIVSGIIDSNISYFILNFKKYQDNEIFKNYFNDYINGDLVDVNEVYKTILNKDIDRRNFRKKILSLGFLEETDEYHKSGSGRPGKLFRFNSKKYKELEQEGINLDIKFA